MGNYSALYSFMLIFLITLTWPTFAMAGVDEQLDQLKSNYVTNNLIAFYFRFIILLLFSIVKIKRTFWRLNSFEWKLKWPERGL